MLQQTQAERVAKLYPLFMRRFPTVRSLARAPLHDVLRAWQGLGYNRRALSLRKMAQAVVARHGGRVPSDPAVLKTLPGIGTYTASAIAAFAYDVPSAMLETNIRTVLLHHFFPKKRSVSDEALFRVAEQTLDREHSRRWHAALMDYGAYLKEEVGNASRRSARYRRQPPFSGSNRQVRGAVIRALTRLERGSLPTLATATGCSRTALTHALKGLERDGMVTVRRKTYILSS